MPNPLSEGTGPCNRPFRTSVATGMPVSHTRSSMAPPHENPTLMEMSGSSFFLRNAFCSRLSAALSNSSLGSRIDSVTESDSNWMPWFW
jgi:hypothetical protein